MPFGLLTNEALMLWLCVLTFVDCLSMWCRRRWIHVQPWKVRTSMGGEQGWVGGVGGVNGG